MKSLKEKKVSTYIKVKRIPPLVPFTQSQQLQTFFDNLIDKLKVRLAGYNILSSHFLSLGNVAPLLFCFVFESLGLFAQRYFPRYSKMS